MHYYDKRIAPFTPDSAELWKQEWTTSSAFGLEGHVLPERDNNKPTEEGRDTIASLGSFESLIYTLPNMLLIGLVLLVFIVVTAFGNLLVCLALLRYTVYIQTWGGDLSSRLILERLTLLYHLYPYHLLHGSAKQSGKGVLVLDGKRQSLPPPHSKTPS